MVSRLAATRGAWAGIRYAARMVASRWRREPALTMVSLYPTHRCNLRCVYCSSPLLDTPELETSQWLAVIDELAELGCRRVAILGGEPLLRRDIDTLIGRVRRRGMACVLTSNGLLVPRAIEKLRQLSTLVLSLDAPGPANDEVRGQGVHAAVGEAIRVARAAGISVKLNAVLSARTAPHLDALLAFVETHDLAVTINPMRSGAPDLWRDAAAYKDEDVAIRALLERLAELARRNRRVLFSPTTFRYAAQWGDYGRDRFEDHELARDDPRRTQAPRCQAGRYYMSINPDGTVYPCNSTVGRLRGGNVARDGVAAAWRTLRDHPCIACFSPCLVEQNFLYSLEPRVVGNFVARHLWHYA